MLFRHLAEGRPRLVRPLSVVLGELLGLVLSDSGVEDFQEPHDIEIVIIKPLPRRSRGRRWHVRRHNIRARRLGAGLKQSSDLLLIAPVVDLKTYVGVIDGGVPLKKSVSAAFIFVMPMAKNLKKGKTKVEILIAHWGHDSRPQCGG